MDIVESTATDHAAVRLDPDPAVLGPLFGVDH